MADSCGRCRFFRRLDSADRAIGSCTIELPPHVCRVAPTHDDDCHPYNMVFETDTCSLFKPIEP